MQYRLVAADVSQTRMVDIPEDYVIVGVQFTQDQTWQVLCLAPILPTNKGLEGVQLESPGEEED